MQNTAVVATIQPYHLMKTYIRSPITVFICSTMKCVTLLVLRAHPCLLLLLFLSLPFGSLAVGQIEEVAPLGSLLDFLKRYRTLVHLEQMHRYCVQVAEGMAYLARHNIVHRDLAARNVLLSNKDMVSVFPFI